MFDFENNSNVFMSYVISIAKKIKSGFVYDIFPIEYMIETLAIVFRYFWFK